MGTLILTGRKPLRLVTAADRKASLIQIASLIFVGEFEEAIRLFERYKKSNEIDLNFIIQAQFYIGIGEVRRSQYLQAAKIFVSNILQARKYKNLEETTYFCAYQGLAFFNFYRGQYRRCFKFANTSYLIAFENDFLYGQALALDALGQSLCHMGEIRRGLFEMNRSIEIAKSLGNGGLSTSLKIAVMRFKAQFGIDSDKTLSHCYRAIKKLNPQNNFSRSEIYLELVRQLILRGQASEGRKIIDESSESIYQNQNKRQLAIYNQRYAYLLFLQDEPHAALALIRSLKTNLDPKIDVVLLRQAEGLERRIQMFLNKSIPLKNLSFSVNFVDRRILSRNRELKNPRPNAGEDPLGDLIDQTFRLGERALSEIICKKFYGLVPMALNIQVSQSIIFFGPLRGQIIICSHGDVLHIEKNITAPMLKILRYLEGGQKRNKQQIIEYVWNYSYTPHLHDQLLHATIAKLRRAFGQFSSWIQWSHDGYSLNDIVRCILPMNFSKNIHKIDTSSNFQTDKVDSRSVVQTKLAKETPLNYRQIQALQILNDGAVLGITEYSKKFKICKMTATRDLGGLYHAGLACRMGKGRATRYSKEIKI